MAKRRRNQASHEEDPLLTCEEAGDLIGKAGMTIRRWVADGIMPFIQLPSGMIRIRRSSLDQFLKLKQEQVK